MSSSSMITPILLLRANIDYLSCSITIFINISLILRILRRKTLRTFRNVFVINISLSLIYSCLTLLISVSQTLQYSISHHINLHLCRLVGYAMTCSFHGIMYSYVLLSINLFHSRNCRLSKIFISIEIILQWCLAFLIPLFLNQIDFQIQGRFCYTRRISLMCWNLLTGLFLPVLFILIFNLSIYWYAQKLRTTINMIEQQKSNSFHRISTRLYRQQSAKHMKLLRQTIIFLLVSSLGWGSFVLIILFDRYRIIPDDIYLIILSFPSISILIITLLIKHWNQPIRKPVFTSNTRQSLFTTTIHYTHSINKNHRNFTE